MARRTTFSDSHKLLLVLLLLIAGCTNVDYKFERMDGDHAVPLPLKFDGISGRRDGASVTAQARFTDGADHVTMNFAVVLLPAAEFRSGTYQATMGGKITAGKVECPSLTFQGGQTALPAVGGLFLLKDDQGRTVYRVRIPATALTRSVVLSSV